MQPQSASLQLLHVQNMLYFWTFFLAHWSRQVHAGRQTAKLLLWTTITISFCSASIMFTWNVYPIHFQSTHDNKAWMNHWSCKSIYPLVILRSQELVIKKHLPFKKYHCLWKQCYFFVYLSIINIVCLSSFQILIYFLT